MPKGIYERTQWHVERIRSSVHRIGIRPGQVIGKRTILAELPQGTRYQRKFAYRCICGKQGTTWLSHLKDGYGCGCGINTNAAVSARQKEPTVASFNELLGSYRREASKRKLAWRIDVELFKQLTKGRCTYCGAPPSASGRSRTTTGHYRYNGIDRVNNSIGYEPGNSVSCCCHCNRAKRALDIDIFLAHALKIHAFWIQEKRSTACSSSGGALDTPHTGVGKGIWWKLPVGESAFRHVLRGYVRSAKKRNHLWSLKENEFRSLTLKACYYCGEPPSRLAETGPSRRNGNYKYSGIDRVDPAKNYTKSNTVACCKNCNYLKHQLDLPAFRKWIISIYTTVNISKQHERTQQLYPHPEPVHRPQGRHPGRGSH